MISVSTSWNAPRHAGWAAAAAELTGLGHPRIALDGAALQPDAAAARRAVREARGVITALFAPPFAAAAPGSPGLLGLADPDDARRSVALAAAFAAAQAAAAAGTGLVVLRVGGIPSADPGSERRRLDRLREGAAPGEVQSETAAELQAVEALRPRYLDALCRALYELCRHAPDVTWLVETPGGALGLPLPSDLLTVADELPRRRIGYWHDAAHAARLAALGALPASAWLAALGDRAAGVTLSDWGYEDDARLPPGAGRVDWTALRGQLGGGMVRVLRLDPAFPGPLLDDALAEASARGF